MEKISHVSAHLDGTWGIRMDSSIDGCSQMIYLSKVTSVVELHEDLLHILVGASVTGLGEAFPLFPCAAVDAGSRHLGRFSVHKTRHVRHIVHQVGHVVYARHVVYQACHVGHVVQASHRGPRHPGPSPGYRGHQRGRVILEAVHTSTEAAAAGILVNSES